MEGVNGRRVALLQVEPDLADGLDPATRRSATAMIRVGTRPVPSGPWDPPLGPPERDFTGYMILSGILLREVTVAGGRSLEVLNSGDLVMPWHEDAASFVTARWQVLTPLRIADIDAQAGEMIARYPPLTTALVRRAMDRSRALAVYAAIASMPGLRDRLVLLFWQMAERWGRKTPDGVHLPLRLTHQMLADIVGAKRPSVSSSLGELARAGVVLRSPSHGWMLHGDPPGTLSMSPGRRPEEATDR